MSLIVFILLLVAIYYIANHFGYGAIGLGIDGILLFIHLWWILAIIAIVGAAFLYFNQD